MTYVGAGSFERDTSYIDDRITRDGRGGWPVEPGRYRAYGYTPSSHRWADAKLKWRALRLGLGIPPADSSPARQQELGLNRDATLRPGKGEGEKLR